MSDRLKTEINIPGADSLVNRTTGLAGMPTKTPDYSQFQIGGAKADIPGNKMVVEPVIISQDTSPIINDSDSSTTDFGNSSEEQNWRKRTLENPNMSAAKSPDPNAEMDQRNIEEEAARGRMGESRAERLIRNGKTPGEIMEGVQLMLEVIGDSNIPSMFNDHWTPQRAFNTLYTRWQNLRVPIKDISTGDNARVVLDENGIGKIADADAADYAIYVKQKMTRQTVRWTIQRVGGKEIETEEQAMMPTYEYHFGTDQERKDMARACERAFLAFGVRAMLGGLYGMTDSALRDDLNGLVTTMFENGKITIPQLIELFNLSDVNEIGKNVEDHTMGDQMEKIIWWQYAMLHCEKRKDLEEFLARPATKALIMPSKTGSSPEQIKVDDEARIRFLKTMLGDWTQWKDDGRSKDTLAKEVAAGYRGPFTKHGNMAARGILSYEEEEDFIKNLAYVAGSNTETVWTAITVMAALNIYNRYAAVEFDDGSFLLELGKANNIKADDRAKAHLPTFQKKERSMGRPSGPEDYYRIAPDICVSWFDMAKVKGQIKPGVMDERTIENLWLGVDGQVDYHRLGSINFKSLPKGSVVGFFQMLWLIGRDGDGTIPATMDAEPDPKQFTPYFMRRRLKYDQITMNAGTLKLENDGFIDPDKAKSEAQRIQKETTEKLFVARKNTQVYLENIEPRDITVRSDGAPITNKNSKNAGLVEASMGLMYDDHIQAVMDKDFLDIEKSALKNPKVKENVKRGKRLKNGVIVNIN